MKRNVPPAQEPAVPLRRRLVLAGASLVLASVVWLPLVHWFFRSSAALPKSQSAVRPLADRLAARHLHLWTDPESLDRELAGMRATNAEWDFMGRTYLVWALGNLCLREPQRKDEYLRVMDRIIDATLQTERDRGQMHFLMPYARYRPFVVQPPRSLFVDGEIAMMLAVRQLVEQKPDYSAPLRQRVANVVSRMEQGPVLCAESYPDECWMFCNALALAAVRVADRVQGTDHGDLFDRWLRSAKARLVDPGTGLLISSFTLDGRPLDGPEGSSIWMVAHCLELIDPEFARRQYDIARRELGAELCGFGYAREWPASWRGRDDVDSGPVIPGLDVSAGSSGCAFVAARSFDDVGYFQALQTALDFAGFPLEREGRLQYCASSQVGDAVLLYASVLGPAWDKVRKGER